MQYPKQPLPANGHYSPAVISRGMVYVSGQLPIDPDTKQIPAGIEAQTRLALANVERMLSACGSTKGDVVLCHVYVSDIADWDSVNAVYAAFFGNHKPARVVVPTRELHHGAKVEIEAMAELNE